MRRQELLQSIATTILDYRQGEIAAPTPDHVDRWVWQFDAPYQEAILVELDHVLKQSYTRKGWDKVRVRIMRWCLRVKLAQNWVKFGELLLSTERRPIVEESHKDGFWGAKPQSDGTLEGANVLGRLLMELRDQLREPGAECLKCVEPVPLPEFLLYGKPIRPIIGSPPPTEPVVDPDLTPSEDALWRVLTTTATDE